jgi:hypothetical protein
MTRFQPTAAIGRPYTNDLLGWFDDFSTTGVYDALGGFSRAGIHFDEALQAIAAGGNQEAGPVKKDQYRRCPGAGETVVPDRTNVPTAEEQEFLQCTDAHRAPGPPE